MRGVLAVMLGVVLTGIWTNRALSLGWRGTEEPNLNTIAELPYDLQTEKAFTGKIKSIGPAPCAALPISSYHIHVIVEGKLIEVHLGPCWYIAEQKMALKEGDTVQGIGSLTSGRSGGLGIIAAREIRRGSDVLRLRDHTGRPLWRQE